MTLIACAGTGKQTSPGRARPAEQVSNATTNVRASTENTTPELEAIFALDGSTSTSLRNPDDGSLEGGVPLPLSGPGLRFNPRRDPGSRYATVETVQSLLRAAAVVYEGLGGLPLVVNDLSLQGGGPIARHGSHQSGRDVDVFFYQLGPEGKPIESVGAFFDPSGRGVDFRSLPDANDDIDLEIDLPRVWRFVQALIEDPHSHLQRIFVAEHLRSLLLDFAKQHGASEMTVHRFSEMTCQPTYPHDDHFHLRFFCAPDDIAAGCRDSEPIYPWWKDRLASSGIEPLPLLPRRPQAVSRTVSAQEARQSAGPMDAKVVQWLDRREAWIAQPHPERPFCR